MHERTTAPIVALNPDGHQTLIVEQGQDGTVIGKMKLEVKNGKITEWEFKQHVMTDDIKEDKTIAAKVAEVRKPLCDRTFVPGQTVTVGGNTTDADASGGRGDCLYPGGPAPLQLRG